MPISSFYGLQTSLRGLLAQQRALDVTGHNIANASTPGYSRQEAVLSATDAQPVVTSSGLPGQLGAGVDVDQYRRIRDGFLDAQFRAQSMRLGYQTTTAATLANAEIALAEPGDDLADVLGGRLTKAPRGKMILMQIAEQEVGRRGHRRRDLRRRLHPQAEPPDLRGRRHPPPAVQGRARRGPRPGRDRRQGDRAEQSGHRR